ncbi:uncharacterized protein LOC116197115 [Punica granatum]|uniref:DUF4378 domain-containing protein n=2 Tax=Punica granatum TaxID=22663 RepID=A0A218X2D0_PUNGR|nr:uncharacterized protein LOC116197115 [Punica granatum]OWM79113.1 hypothetical protein CDL15_Pgr003284 [Punica granatum]PKI49298.1 hypothetical protein CRG98_030226 [Punica granatum]
MAQKHLRDLLCEDQEPFLLTSYVADLKSQLTSPTKSRKLIKPAAPTKTPASFAGTFCKNVCLFSVLPDSPDPRKSPLFDFAASPHKSPNRIFLHVPAKTAAMLLEAAVRIQQKSASSVKPKPVKKGLFGSLLKRLTHRNRAGPAREIESHRRRSFGASRGDAAKNMEMKCAAEKSASPCGCRGHSRRSSGLWSESNGERSLDLETSTSGSDSVELAAEEEEVYAAFDESFCESPFRFVLRRSPSSSGERTPDFASPAASPARHGKQEINRYDLESSNKLNTEEEEEEKEQCSPVSVLEPPFEDGQDQEEEDDDALDYECGFANVQRAKQQLLEKLHRFEKLAELDPVELEKRMLDDDNDDEEEEGDYDYISRAEGSEDGQEPEPSDDELRTDRCITEILKSRFDNVKKIPNDMKRLVSDLVAEEWGRENELGATVTRRVCERFESWKRVDLNTIDMMVEKDFRRELDGWCWKENQDQAAEIVSGIEVTIFRSLVEELLEDLY